MSLHLLYDNGVRKEDLLQIGRVTWLDSFHRTSTSNSTTQVIVELLLEEIDRFSGTPGFYWGIQDLIQAKTSPVGIDGTGYSEL